jgi:hypothetical protein
MNVSKLATMHPKTRKIKEHTISSSLSIFPMEKRRAETATDMQKIMIYSANALFIAVLEGFNI